MLYLVGWGHRGCAET